MRTRLARPLALTAAAMLALYLHLVRQNRLSLAELGFRRPTPRLFHLLWQIPVSILVCGSLQGIFLVWLSSLGVDTASAGTADDPLADIAALPEGTRRLLNPHRYHVSLGASLQARRDALIATLRDRHGL